jgi:hypothetical protein
MWRWRHKAPKYVLGVNFSFFAKVVLGHFGTTWGIWHRTSTKDYRRIEASPMALRCGLFIVLVMQGPPSHNLHLHCNELIIYILILNKPGPAALGIFFWPGPWLGYG